MLSRVDGRTNAAEIGMLTGLGEAVLPILEKLSDLGAVEGVRGAAPAPPPPRPPSASPAPATTRAGTAPPPRVPSGSTALPPPRAASSGSAAPPPRAASPTAAPPTSDARQLAAGAASEGRIEIPWAGLQVPDGGYRPDELEQEADLELDKKRRILSVFYALPRLDHYQLLGVDRHADKKAVKAAYYKLAGEFHPDKHFRKNLGAFKQKMEAIFKHLTLAEDTLSHKESRAEYDERLVVREQSLVELELFSREEALPPPPPRKPSAPEVVASPTAPSAAPAPPPRRVSSPAMVAAAPPPRRSSEVAITMASGVPRHEAAPVSSRGVESRRGALLSKLSSGRFPVARPVEPEAEPLDPAEAAEQLRRMAAAKAANEQKSQLQRYLDVAEEAAQRGDAVAAANSYRFAAALEPNPELQHLARQWGAKAAAALADGYHRQGERAASDGDWPDAARTLVRAAAGMPGDARVLSIAANALVKAQGDLHHAADLARRAVELAPQNFDFRLTLAEVYVAANLKLSARRELEAAAKIAPDNAKVRALLKEVG